MKKFKDFSHDLTSSASEDRVQNVVKLADSLIAEQHSSKEAIQERRTVLLQQWDIVKEAAVERKASLEKAKELHAFVRDAAETKSRIQVCGMVSVGVGVGVCVGVGV